jgi:hypothetical protein
VRRRASRVVVDPVLETLAFRCWPNGCPKDRTCCMGLVVEVSKREVRAIDTMMDELARLVPSLREVGGYASVFVDDPPGVTIESLDDGSCPFLFRTQGHALCSIHTTAMISGRAVEDFKPASCRHWPITLVRDGDRVRVTVHEAARRIGCVAPVRQLPGQPTVLEAFEAEIAEICGAAVQKSRARASRRPRPRR